MHFPHEPSQLQRAHGERCRLKIDPCSQSCPLPSGGLEIYADHSHPGNNLPASLYIQGCLRRPHALHVELTAVYQVLSPVQSAEWRHSLLTHSRQSSLVQLNHIADFWYDEWRQKAKSGLSWALSADKPIPTCRARVLAHRDLFAFGRKRLQQPADQMKRWLVWLQ